MTRNQAVTKIHELVTQLSQSLEEKAIKVLDWSSVDAELDGAEDNYLIPKVCVYVAQSEMANSYRPVYKDHREWADSLARRGY